LFYDKYFRMKRVLVFFCFMVLFGNAVVAQWQMTSFVNGRMVQTLVEHHGVLFAGTEGGGVFSSADEGLNWTHLSNNLLLNDVKWLASFGNVLMVAGSYATPVYSVDNGVTWGSADYGLGGVDIDIVASTCDGILAGVLGQLMRFDTISCSWKVFSSTPINTKIVALDCNYPFFFAGTSWYGLYVSPTWGGFWVKSEVSGDLDPTVTGFARVGDEMFCGSVAEGLFKSSDFGNHWASLDALQSDVPISIVSSDNLLVASTVSGVQYSTDLGNTWVQWNEGLVMPLTKWGEAPSLLVTAGYLIMAGNSIWRRPLSDITSTYEQPGRTVRCYPNPASGLIEFQGCITDADITILAADGSIAAVGQLENHQFDISYLPQGFYLCRLSTGDSVMTTWVLKQ